MLWFDKDSKIYDNIGYLTQLIMKHSASNTYIQIHFIKKEIEERIEYLQIKLGHYKPSISIKKIPEAGCKWKIITYIAICCKQKRLKRLGFLNLYVIMDLEVLKDI